MTQSEQADRSGFLSENDKRKFTTAAGVLGCVFFLVQFAGPMLAVLTMMPAMMLGNGMKSYAVRGATFFQRELYVVETTERFGPWRAETSRSRLVKVGPEQLEQVVVLQGWEPFLLADDDRLWLISSSRVSVFVDGSLKALPAPEPLGDICRPFVFRGMPTVVENRPDGGWLSSWTGDGWETIRDLPVARGTCHFQPLVVGDSVWLFRRDGDTLYVQDAMADEPDWNVVLSRPSMWYAFTRSGRPAVASSDFENGLRIVRHDGERWTTVASSPESLGMWNGHAVFEDDDAGLLILSESFPGSVTVRRWEGARPEVVHRFGSSFPFSSSMMWMMMLPQLGTMTLSLVLAVILSSLMRAHRVSTYRYENTEVAYASLTRRALSQVVDALIAGLPAAFVYWWTFGDFERMFERGPSFFFQIFAGFAGCMLWMGLVFVAFAVSEGFWGVTPGKWLVSIRVVGTDLRPCGFGRALLRNVLKLVDGFFNFIVGVLLIAFTPEWQRLGDLAARTIVIAVSRDATDSAQSA